MIVVKVGDNDMAHGVPTKFQSSETAGDVALATLDPGVDDGGFATARHYVRRDKAQVDAFPDNSTVSRGACGGGFSRLR